MHSDEERPLVHYVGRGGDGKHTLLITGTGEPSVVRRFLHLAAEADRATVVASVVQAEKVRDDHYSTRGELREQITALAECLRARLDAEDDE